MDKSSLKLNKVLNKTGSSLRYSKCVVLQKNKVNAQKRLMKHENTKNWLWNKILKSKKKINQSRNRMERVKLFIKMTYNSNLFVNVLFSYRLHFCNSNSKSNSNSISYKNKFLDIANFASESKKKIWGQFHKIKQRIQWENLRSIS